MIDMFQQYQYAIMTPNFNRFTYVLMRSTHSTFCVPHITIFTMFEILFVFNLLSMSFLLFQQLPASAAILTPSVAFLFW